MYKKRHSWVNGQCEYCDQFYSDTYETTCKSAPNMTDLQGTRKRGFVEISDGCKDLIATAVTFSMILALFIWVVGAQNVLTFILKMF